VAILLSKIKIQHAKKEITVAVNTWAYFCYHAGPLIIIKSQVLRSSRTVHDSRNWKHDMATYNIFFFFVQLIFRRSGTPCYGIERFIIVIIKRSHYTFPLATSYTSLITSW
jgi:hypothetical protein